jgi:uncharacterized OB-fold protein
VSETIWELPVPITDAWSAPYFKAWSEQRLIVQHCPVCSHWQHYPRALCVRCGADPVFEEQPAEGVVHTFTVVRQMGGVFRERTPFAAAVVEIACGVRIFANVTDCDPDDVYIGMPVRGYAVVAAEDIGIPYWRPVAPREGEH